MTPRIDEELRSLIPPLKDDERAQLEENIKAYGCRDALVTWNGTLLDGHNRLEICERLGLPYRTEEIVLADRDAAMDWMDANQLGRRNLTPDQFRLLLGRRYNRTKKARTDNLKQNTPKGQIDSSDVSTADALAAQHGVSPATVKRAGKAVEDLDVKMKEPRYQNMTQLEVLAEARRLTRQKKKSRSDEIQMERREIAQRAIAIEPSKRYSVVRSDMNDWEPPALADVIITDPPYPKEYLHLWEDVARNSDKWLKPNGILVAMSGQSYLDQIYFMMSKHMDYYWTACYYTPGQPTPLRHVNVNTTWKPLLIYCRKGERHAGKIFGDFMQSDGNDKDFHKWGQSVSGMDAVLERFALPGQTVIDPFCGAGTTGVAAIKRGCLFHGCDIIEENVGISISRISEVSQ